MLLKSPQSCSINFTEELIKSADHIPILDLLNWKAWSGAQKSMFQLALRAIQKRSQI